MAKTSPSLLFYSDTDSSPDLLYFGRFQAPDPFIAFQANGKKYGVLNALEIGRGQKSSGFDKILSLETWFKQAREGKAGPKAGIPEVIIELARAHKVRSFTVPYSFPAGLIDRLRALGLKVVVCDGQIIPEREIKTDAEAAAIKEGNRCSALGFAAVEKILRESVIKGRRIVHNGRTVTSEMLQTAVEIACLEAGAVSSDTIVAGGDQGCDPHERGHGPIGANELIVVDIFPRVTRTGYHGDMTRTFLKGKASDVQCALVAAVREAQLAAFKQIKSGANGRDAHRACVDVFDRLGYQTKTGPKGSVGFFHGTGHGLGLAVHELPRLSGTIDYILPKHSVVTVEPGLYYPGLGGCRIEDVVQVTDTKPKMLSKYHYDWQIA